VFRSNFEVSGEKTIDKHGRREKMWQLGTSCLFSSFLTWSFNGLPEKLTASIPAFHWLDKTVFDGI
jgi:hypothetical protein